MNFSKFDISVLVVMSLAVIVMSYMYPALGMSTAPAVNESDVPEFNISSSTYDITGQFPEPPRLSDSGQLEFDEDGLGSSAEGVSLLYIQRPKEDGYSIETYEATSGDKKITVINWANGTVSDQYDYPINSEGQTVYHEEDGFTITFEVEKIENGSDSDTLIVVDYKIQSAPDSSDGISSIPLIGDAADLVATVISYGVTAFAYISLVIVEIVINVISVSVSLALFLFGQGVFLAATYTDIVTSAPSWAGVVLAVPGLLVSAEFAKLAIVVSKIFPTT